MLYWGVQRDICDYISVVESNFAVKFNGGFNHG